MEDSDPSQVQVTESLDVTEPSDVTKSLDVTEPSDVTKSLDVTEPSDVVEPEVSDPATVTVHDHESSDDPTISEVRGTSEISSHPKDSDPDEKVVDQVPTTEEVTIGSGMTDSQFTTETVTSELVTESTVSGSESEEKEVSDESRPSSKDQLSSENQQSSENQLSSENQQSSETQQSSENQQSSAETISGNSKSIVIRTKSHPDPKSVMEKLEKDGTLDLSDLKTALDTIGIKIPQWQVRQMIDDTDKGKGPIPSTARKNGHLTFEQFEQLCTDLRAKDVALTFKSAVTKRENIVTLSGTEKSSAGTTHSVRNEEQVAFSDWINSNLSRDPDLKHLLPIDVDGRSLYEAMNDGILLCKIINHSCPDTIDERAINKKNLTIYTKHENLTLGLTSAQSIGCNVINIDGKDLSRGTPHLVLGLLWQIIRIGLFNQISLENCPGLIQLLQPDEEMADLLKLSPETILLRWVNYHLEQSGSPRRVNNFTNDIKDSECYGILMKQIAPKEVGVSLVDVMIQSDLNKRAEVMLQQADKLHCRHFIAPSDVVNGVYKLNLAFVANLFNNHPALEQPDEPLELENIEETREEKTYRNWMNSLGVSPYVNWLYSDLADGLIIFQLFDIIKPGVVNWKQVHRTFSKLKGFMEKLENCNYAVELGKVLKFSLVGIAGQDISEGNPTLTLALVWQLMRAYTLSILTQLTNNVSNGDNGGGSGKAIVEREIVEWANNKLKSAGKESSIRGFQDPVIATATPVIDLIDAIKPGSINYSAVLPGSNDEEKLANAKYAISMARKTGARIYALPEDIAEVKQKMVMTVFACLMARDYLPGSSATGNSGPSPPVTTNGTNGIHAKTSSSSSLSTSSPSPSM